MRDFDLPSGDYGRDLTDGKHVVFRRGESEPLRQVEDEDRTIEFIASTDGIKRDGNRVRNDGWDFSNFEKNPVFLWGHDQGGGDKPPLPPIGSISEYWVEEVDGADSGITSQLKIRVRFATHDLAETVFQLYRQGHLRAVSIGWTPLEYEPILDGEGVQVGWDFIRSELLEVSAVPVPADPDALMVAAASGVLPQDQIGAFARAMRSSHAGAYWLDSRSATDDDNQNSEERTDVEDKTRAVEWEQAGEIIDGLEAEIDRLGEAIEAGDREAIEKCVAMTESLIEKHEEFLHAVYDEFLSAEDEDAMEDEDEDEMRLLAVLRDRLTEVLEADAALQKREYDPAMLDAARSLLADLRGDVARLIDAHAAEDAAAMALEIGHAMERLGDLEVILGAIYAEFLFDDEQPEEEETPAEEEAPAEEEVEEETLDALVAELDALIARTQSRAVVASEDAETANLARVSDGAVNLTSDWEMTPADEDAILGDPENPDWEAYASAHLGRETDAAEETKGHYKYPVAKLQDGEMVLFVSALRAVRSFAAREGAQGVFDAAGRIMEAIKADLMAEEETPVEEASRANHARIGAKISGARGAKIYEAREMCRGACRILDEVLAEATMGEDEEERTLDDETLLQRLGDLAVELGVPTEADLLARISELAETLNDRPTSPEEFAEKLLAAK